MQFTALALLALVAGVLGLPPSIFQDLEQSGTSSDLVSEPPGACGPLMNKAVCCRKSLLGAIDIGCHRPQPEPQTGPELAAACALTKKLPRCCILGIVGYYGPCGPPQSVAKELGYLNDTEDSIQAIGTDQYWDLELM